MNRRMGRWMNGQTYRGQTDGQMDEWTNIKRADGWTDGRMDKHKEGYCGILFGPEL